MRSNLRTVICDIYKTVLEVGPAPADSEARWQRLLAGTFSPAPRMSLAEFNRAVEAIVARDHAGARTVGVPYPEVCWPAVVMEVLPELRRLPEAGRDHFLWQQTQTWHQIRLMPGAADGLRSIRDRGLGLGIASNAQAYTLHELAAALTPVGLSLEIFDPALRFWSFEHGFSKPDPHAFRILGARLLARGVTPSEILMVGDRLDNDLEPARAQGWQTWHLTNAPSGPGAGSWADLERWLASLE